ncbi:MAG: hypothetical protein IKH77_02090 [Clostridia bacterium]|nr:hypothetical protein [Clostridia bacterium]
MKRILSILLALAMLLSLTTGVADTAALTACTTAGYTYDAPADWRRADSGDDTTYFYSDSGMLMVMVQDMTDYSSILGALGDEDMYNAVGDGIAQGLGEDVKTVTTMEQAGSISGAYCDIDTGAMLVGGFITKQDNKLVAVMYMDTAKGKDEIHDFVIQVASTLRTGDEKSAEPTADKNDNLDLDSLLQGFTDNTAAADTKEAQDTSRVPYTLGSFTFNVPADWEAAPSENAVQFSWKDDSIFSMLQVNMQDLSEHADMLKLLDSETLYNTVTAGITSSYEGMVLEPATCGSIEGRKLTMTMMGIDMVGFLTIQNNTMLLFLGADSSMSGDQMMELVSGVVETLTW